MIIIFIYNLQVRAALVRLSCITTYVNDVLHVISLHKNIVIYAVLYKERNKTKSKLKSFKPARTKSVV